MTSVFIQIPCYNEEATLPITLAALPRRLPGVERVEWLVIDDGSDDRTAEVARAHGVDHVIQLGGHRGLACAFVAGLEECLRLGADVVVNTDADNQYDATELPRLVAPILEGRADIVVGSRPISRIEHFSPLKKWLQRAGSWVVRRASQTQVQDAPCGFRAIRREAAMQLSVFDKYTYTLETIIQAGQHGLRVESLPIRVNPDLRPSRLVKGSCDYVLRSVLTILRIFIVYRPLRFFALVGLLTMIPGVLLGVRFTAMYMEGRGAGHVQSLILAALLVTLGFSMAVAGILGDLISINRRLLEDLRVRMRSLQSRTDAHGTGLMTDDQLLAAMPVPEVIANESPSTVACDTSSGLTPLELGVLPVLRRTKL